MKNILVLSTIALVFILSACSGNSETNKPAKGSDKPDFSKVQPKTKGGEKKPVTNRKPSSPEQLAKAEAILASVSEEDLTTVNGKQIYKNYCGICHGITGDLNVNGATDLTTSDLPMNERVAQVYHGRGLMTPFKGLLKDKEIVAVTQYIEDLRK